MDFCIPDTDLDIDLRYSKEVKKDKSDCSSIDVTFIDSNSFESYLNSYEHSDSSFHIGGALCSLADNNLDNDDQKRSRNI